MAPTPLAPGEPRLLPREAELQAFARAAAQLLVDRVPRRQGARTVARRPGVGLQALDHRDYLPGDEIRHVDWRLSARLQRTVVRRHEAESGSDWWLLLDASASMAAGGGARWPAACRLGAALAYALLQSGHRVGWLACDQRVRAECRPGRGATQYAAIARALRQLAPQGAGFSPAAALPRLAASGASLVMITDFLADEELQAELLRLRPRCRELHALQLREAGDTRLAIEPAAGLIDLIDVESGQRLSVHAGVQAEARAAEARAAMTVRLRNFCRRSGIAFSDCDVAQPWQRTLLQHLTRARLRC